MNQSDSDVIIGGLFILFVAVIVVLVGSGVLP